MIVNAQCVDSRLERVEQPPHKQRREIQIWSHFELSENDTFCELALASVFLRIEPSRQQLLV